MNKYVSVVITNYFFFFLSTIFFIVVTAVAVRVMGEEIYGSWAIISAIIVFSSVGNLGINAIVMKFSAEKERQTDQRTHFSFILTAGYAIVLPMSILTSLVLFLLRNSITYNIHFSSLEYKEQFSQALLWITFCILPQFLSRVPSGFLLSQLRNRMVRQIELFYNILLWVGIIVISLYKANLLYFAIWCFITNLFIFGIYLRVVQQDYSLKLDFDRRTIQSMSKFSGYMFIGSIAVTFFQQFDKIIVGFVLGPAIAGVYSIGTSVALRLSIAIGQATEVMIPYASLNDTMEDRKKLFTVYRQLSRYVSLALAIVSSLIIIWMQEILTLWISPDFAIRYSVSFRILILAYGLLNLCRPAHQMLTGMGKVKFTSLIYLALTLVMLSSIYFFSGRFGLLGATASNLTLVGLLVFNLYVYSLDESNGKWISFFNDLKLGIFWPFFSFVLFMVPLSAGIITKIVVSALISLICFRIILKDSFTRNYFLKVLHLFHKTSR